MLDDPPAPRLSRKHRGAYYTPDAVARSLVSWATRDEQVRMLDPSCGEGAFIAAHPDSVGIERDAEAARRASARAPWALVHEGDFFSWAEATPERFGCAAGNPPFLRYQTFKGETRERAIALCARRGAEFSGLSSSWAPFIVAAAGLLVSGGRLAFVVPAEIGHAPYAAPLLDYLTAHFASVHVVATREKLFPELSEDCWLLYAEGFGGRTDHIRFTAEERFTPSCMPPAQGEYVSGDEFRAVWNRRLRPFLLPPEVRDLYRAVAEHPDSRRLNRIGDVGIGYVSGDNSFFHLRPSEALFWSIPGEFLYPTVRNGHALPAGRVTRQTVEGWRKGDAPAFLLRIQKHRPLPPPIHRYLDSAAGQRARQAYKCRNREPWYAVPDVRVPDYFLTYMSGREVNLVRNDARVTCSNTIHGLRVRDVKLAKALLPSWEAPFTQLSCELEGHALGGGMLKLEPREAGRVLFPSPAIACELDTRKIVQGVETMRRWRHYA